MASEALGTLQALNNFLGNPVTYTAGAFLAKSLERRPLESFSTGAVSRVANSARARAIASQVPGKVEQYDTLSTVTDLIQKAGINPRTPLPQAVSTLIARQSGAVAAPSVVKSGPASPPKPKPSPVVKPAVIKPKGPQLVASISDAEMRSIDAALKAGAAVHYPALTGRAAFDAASAVALGGEAPAVAPPAIRPTVALLPAASAGPVKPNVGSSKPGGNDVNLSGILGGLQSVANVGLGLATTYSQIDALIHGRATAPAASATPPAVTPASNINRPVMTTSGFVPTQTATIAQNALYQPAAQQTLAAQGLIQPAMAAIPSTLLRTGGALAIRGVGKAAAIAAATGLGIDVVSGILEAGRPRRRRRRMLTKSDVADISTMSALLGKNSEAFKTWLAGALRR